MKYEELCELYSALNGLEERYNIANDDADFSKIHLILDNEANRFLARLWRGKK